MKVPVETLEDMLRFKVGRAFVDILRFVYGTPLLDENMHKQKAEELHPVAP